MITKKKLGKIIKNINSAKKELNNYIKDLDIKNLKEIEGYDEGIHQRLEALQLTVKSASYQVGQIYYDMNYYGNFGEENE